MTPAPTTASFFGTLSKSSAPQLSTMFLPSKGMLLSSVGIGSGREHDVLRAQGFLLAVVRGELDLAASQQLAVALQRGDAGALEQHGDAAGAGLDDAGLALLHLRDVELTRRRP